jgi:hypothetical protein
MQSQTQRPRPHRGLPLRSSTLHKISLLACVALVCASTAGAQQPAPAHPATPVQSRPPPAATTSASQREADLREELSTLDRQATQISALRQSNPVEYLRQKLDNIAKHQALAQKYKGSYDAGHIETELPRQYAELADLARYRLADPRRAIELYQRAASPSGRDTAVDIADTYQFDLNDRANALKAYRQAIERLRATQGSAQGESTVLMPLLLKSYQAQVDQLESGKRYSAAPSMDDLQACQVWMLYAGGGSGSMPPQTPAIEALRAKASQKVDMDAVFRAMPRSTVLLQQSFILMQEVREPAVLTDYFARSDPSGFWTAHMLGLINVSLARRDGGSAAEHPISAEAGMPAPRALIETARRYARASPAMLPVANAADPKLTSPGSTWLSYIDALKTGNAGAALACLTPQLRETLGPLLKVSTPTQLKAIGESFTGFALGTEMQGVREANITRHTGKGDVAGIATFIDSGGRWLIDSM